MSKYKDMTVEELDLAIQELQLDRAALKMQQAEVVRIRDHRAARVSARRKVEGFTEAEREALAQMVAPEGIETGERVGRLALPAWLRGLLGRA